MKALIFRRRLERDLEDEIAFHLAMREQEHRDDGLHSEDARAAAAQQFGNRMRWKETMREMWTFTALESLWHDTLYAARVFRRSPGFTGAAIVTLALGIGVNTAVFTMLYAVAFRPLPVKDPASVVNVYQEFKGRYSRQVYGSPLFLSYPEYLNYRQRSHVLSGLAAYAEASFSLGADQGEALRGQLTTCDYFTVLAVEMAAGRAFLPDECRAPGEGSVAVLSYGFWQRRFGGVPAVLGKTLVVNRHALTIVGVAERDFVGTEMLPADVWVPLTMQPQLMPGPGGSFPPMRNLSWLKAIGRLKPGVSAKQARADLEVIARQADQDYPGRRTEISVDAGAFLNGPEVREKGSLLAVAGMGIVGLVVLMACANVMNLLLSRATARRREIGVRLALGANRRRLVRQLLTESLFLGMLGGGVGLLVAYWLPPVLVAAIPEEGLRLNLNPNLTVFAYAFAVSLAAAVVFGLAPALQSTRMDLAAALKGEGALIGRGHGRSRLRNSLVVTQVAGCMLLLVTAGLLVRGLERAQNTDPGFATDDVLVVSLDLQQQGYDAARAALFHTELREGAAALPGVEAVAAAGIIPLQARGSTAVTPESGDLAAGGSPAQVNYNVVSAHYFSALQIPLLRGRAFPSAEAQSGAPIPAVINTAMARFFWNDREALGQRFHTDARTQFEVVGIAADVSNVHLGQPDGPFFYAAARAEDLIGAKLLVRVAGDASPVRPALTEVVRALDANVLVTVARMEDGLERIFRPLRAGATLTSLLGLLAAVLAAVGVCGVVAYAASQRTREIGIRMALGAMPRQVLSLLVRQGLRLAATGLGVGLALAAGSSLLLSGVLFGLSPLDPLAFAGTSALLLIVTLLAMAIPAWRAARLDPSRTLHYE